MKKPHAHRYWATPAFRQQLAKAGRRADWLAARIGVSPSYLSKVFAGDRRLSETQARVAAGLLDGEFSLLFESLNGVEIVSVRERDEVPA